jgi:hypothetical protein
LACGIFFHGCNQRVPDAGTAAVLKLNKLDGKMKNKDPHLLSNLPAYGEDGSVYAVVESPKGSLV